MSLEKSLRNAALIAGCAVVLASCGGAETGRNAASASAMQSGGDTALESPQASAMDTDVPTPLEAGAGDAWPRRAVCPDRSSWTIPAGASRTHMPSIPRRSSRFIAVAWRLSERTGPHSVQRHPRRRYLAVSDPPETVMALGVRRRHGGLSKPAPSQHRKAMAISNGRPLRRLHRSWK
jgi:hypothetical protein